jgi:hypothetical protein
LIKANTHGEFNPAALETHQDLILRLHFKISLKKEQDKFFVGYEFTYARGFVTSKFNNVFGDLVEDEINNVWAQVSINSSNTSYTFDSSNIIILKHIFDEKILNSINLAYKRYNFDKAATFDIQLKIFEYELSYRSYNFTKKSALRLLKDCRNILIKSHINRSDADVNKCIKEFKDKLKFSLPQVEPELKNDSDFKFNNQVLLFSNNKETLIEQSKNSQSRKMKYRCNIM